MQDHSTPEVGASQQELAARLSRLERDNRRLRRTGGAALAGLGLLSLMSFAAPTMCKVVWAERFVLKDGSMKQRITFDAYGVEHPRLTFRDDRGKAVSTLEVHDNGNLVFHKVEGGQRVPARIQLGTEGQLEVIDARNAAAAEASSGKKTKSGNTGVN